MSYFPLLNNNATQFPQAVGQPAPQPIPQSPQNSLSPRSVIPLSQQLNASPGHQAGYPTNGFNAAHRGPFHSRTALTTSSHWNKELPKSCWQVGDIPSLVQKYEWMQPILSSPSLDSVQSILKRGYMQYSLNSAEELLSLAAVIGSLSLSPADIAACYSSVYFGHWVMNLPASEKGTLFKYASISKHPHAGLFKDAMARYLFIDPTGNSVTLWPSEQQKLQTLISEIEQLQSKPDYLDSFELNFDKNLPHFQACYKDSLEQLKDKCIALQTTLEEGTPVHLPKYYLNLGQKPCDQNSLKSLSGYSRANFTEVINPVEMGTILAFPSHFEWALPNNPNEPIVLEPTNGTSWAFCGVVQRFSVLTEMWVSGSFSFAQINDSLFLTNWQCALMSAILKKNYPTLIHRLKSSNPSTNRPLQAMTPPSQPTIPPVSTSQPLPTFSVPPMQTPQQSVITQTPTLSQTAATTSQVAQRANLKPKTMLNKSLKETLNYLSHSQNRTRTLDKNKLDEILELKELSDEQKKRLNAFLDDPAYFITFPNSIKLYKISIPAIIEILSGKPVAILQKKVKVNPPAPLPPPSNASSIGLSSSSSSSTTTTTSSAQAVFASTHPRTLQHQQPVSHKRAVPAGAFMPQAQRARTELTPDYTFSRAQQIIVENKILKMNEDDRSPQEQILLFIYELQRNNNAIKNLEAKKNSKELLKLSQEETPDDFYTEHPYLNPLQKGDVGEKFWASQAYSKFRIERFIELSHSNPELFRAATMEGVMNTYCQTLRTAEAKDVESIVIGIKAKSEKRIKKAMDLFELSEADAPPAYRQVWDDQDNDDVSLYGRVVGYNPEFLFDIKPVQTLLLYTILSLSASDRALIEDAYLMYDEDNVQRAVALIAYEILKNSQEGTEEQRVFRDCILCKIPNPEDKEWQEEPFVIVDYNTFDRTEAHGRNYRLNPNEPHFLWKLFNKLDENEQKALREHIINQSSKNEKIDLVYSYLLDMANAIKDRYFSRVDNKNGRRSSPMKISNDPIFEALNGATLEDIKQLETFGEAIRDYPTK